MQQIFLILTPLYIIAIRNLGNEDKAIPSIIVLIVTQYAYLLYNYAGYSDMAAYIGYYGYQSIAPLVSSILLYFFRGNTSTALITLFTVVVFFNTLFYLLELATSADLWVIYQTFIWLAYTMELAILLCPRMANGVNQVIFRICCRDYAAHDLGIWNINHHHQNS